MKNHVPNDTTDTILEDHEVLYKRKISRAKRRCKKKNISREGYSYAAKVNLVYQICEHVKFLF